MSTVQNEVGIAIRLGRAMLGSAFLLSTAAIAAPATPSPKPIDIQALAEAAETEAGIPVTDALTRQKCGTCHTPDSKGNLSRISWMRTTPEGWSMAIKRMTRLNGVQLTAEESRSIIKYLGTHHGLAPQEAKPIMYLDEHRLVDETNIPNETLRQTCAACHGFAQPLSWRRSQREWAQLQNMHAALYATAADIAFARYADTPPSPDGKKDEKKPKITQGQVALEYFSKNAPLHTAEWTAWQKRAGTAAAKLAGQWVVEANVPGKGRYVGEMTITQGNAADEFTTSVILRSVSGHGAISRTGKGTVYAGFNWRGTSSGKTATAAAAPDALSSTARETLWFSPDQKSAEGRWYWGAYQEFGFDVKLTRVAGPTLAAVAPYALKAGSKDVALHLYGANLPTDVTPQQIQLGAGVTPRKIVSVARNELVVLVDVDAKAKPGLRDVAVRTTQLKAALPVYEKVDYIKVAPDNTMARLGGIRYPKGYRQFEAVGYANGPDGKPETKDDILLGAVDATWSLEEFYTTHNDDDLQYVGTLSAAGLFTPNVEGPNPKRPFVGFQQLAAKNQKFSGPKGNTFGREAYDGRNNYGEVWVVATAKNETDSAGKPLSARSYLIVTVPTYRSWDQPEVSQ